MKTQKETSLSILIHIAQEDIPESEIDLWPGLYKALISSPLSGQKGDPGMFTRRCSHSFLRFTPPIVIGIGLVFTLLIAVFMLMPERQVLAETFWHLFNPTTAQQFSTPSAEELATPTFAPTYAVTLAPFNEIAATPTSLAVAAEPATASISACGADPFGYACKIVKAEKQAGFDAKEFPTDPKGFTFNDVIKAEPGEIMLEYDVIGGGGYLYLNQGIGLFPSFTGLVPEDAIEEVRVGEFRGEYVSGDYVYGGIYTQMTWVPAARSRLRWIEGNHWFELDKEAALPGTDYMTREVMITMATQLVEHAEPVQGPQADHLVSLDEASQLAEFDILRPTVLPQGFEFSYASYEKDLSQLKLHYTPGGNANPETGTAILIVETALDKLSLDPAYNGMVFEGEQVEVNGYAAVYSGSTDNHAINWQTDRLQITLLAYSSRLQGATFTRDQILDIARSIQ